MSVSPEIAMRTLERRYEALQASWQARADRLVGEVRERIPSLAAAASIEGHRDEPA